MIITVSYRGLQIPDLQTYKAGSILIPLQCVQASYELFLRIYVCKIEIFIVRYSVKLI